MFDLSQVSEQFYRDQLRLARWTCGGGFIVLAGVVIGRLALVGIELNLVPIYIAIAALEGLLLSIAFWYAVRGPVELSVAAGSIAFSYRGGRVRRIDTNKKPSRFLLLERVVPPTSTRIRTKPGPGLFLVTGLTRIPLTRAAFDAITSEMARAGFTHGVRRRSSTYEGDWQINDYAHVMN